MRTSNQLLVSRGHRFRVAETHCANCGGEYWELVKLISLGGSPTCLQSQLKPQPALRRTRVYIAGPYSQGNPEANVRRAIDAADALLERNYAPFIPHLTHYWHLQHNHPYETWMQLDAEWVTTCDCVLRLEGPSPGADREIVLATNKGIPVYLSLDTLVVCEPPLISA